MQRPAIMLRFSLSPAIEKLSDSDAGRLLKGALAFGERGEVPNFADAPLLDIVWSMVSPQLQHDEQRYAEKCRKNRYSNYCGKARKSGETPLDFSEWLRTQPNATVCDHSDGNSNSNNKGNDNQNIKNNESVSVIEGSPSQMRAWALMDAETVQSVIGSHILRAYRIAQERQNRFERLPQETRDFIGGIADKLAMPAAKD